jgi:hypothetical protein
MVTTITEDFSELTGHRLSSVSFLKLFNILKDDDNNEFLNIFRSYSVNEDILSNVMNYTTYEIEDDEYVENISYKLYENINLWWMVFLANNINNPFEDFNVGQNIKILKESLIPLLIREIRNVSEE